MSSNLGVGFWIVFHLNLFENVFLEKAENTRKEEGDGRLFSGFFPRFHVAFGGMSLLSSKTNRLQHHLRSWLGSICVHLPIWVSQLRIDLSNSIETLIMAVDIQCHRLRLASCEELFCLQLAHTDRKDN